MRHNSMSGQLDYPTLAMFVLGGGFFALSTLGFVWIKAIPALYLLISCGLVGLAVFWQRSFPKPDSALALLLAALILWGGLSTLWSVDQEAAWSRVVKLTLMFVPAIGLFSPLVLQLIAQRALPLQRWLGLGLFLIWPLPIIELLFGFPFHQWLGLPVVDSVYNEPTTCFILLAWPAGMFLWAKGHQWLAFVLALLTAVLAFIGYSNTAGLAVIASVVVFAGARLWFRQLRALIAIVTVVVGIGMPWLISPLAMPARDMTAHWLPGSALARLEIYAFIGDLARERPLQGWGVESSAFLPLPPEYEPHLQYMREMPLHPHNLFLELWVELGLVGAIIGVALLVLVLRRVDRLTPEARPFALAAFAGLLTIDLLAYSIWSGSLMGITIMTCLAFCLGPAAMERHDLRERNASVGGCLEWLPSTGGLHRKGPLEAP